MAWSQDRSKRGKSLPPNWRATRERILARDHGRCRSHDTNDGSICGAPATDVHHANGPDDHRDESLLSLCGYHHNRETGRQGGRARAAIGNERRKPERHPGLS
jgi:5-methylcytosine-specific restriction enzyme A